MKYRLNADGEIRNPAINQTRLRGFQRAREGTARQSRYSCTNAVVPLAGIEPALLAELDFESSASTNSATGARRRIIVANGGGSTVCVAVPTQ
jgi:hypothetical protein